MSNEYLADYCDQLLGVNRNDPLSKKITKRVQFYDSDVCKSFIVGFCPFQIFANTKSDMGTCPKRYHDESLRDQYRREGRDYVEKYELDYLEVVYRLIAELQRKIRKAEQRLETKATEEVELLLNPEKDEFQERRAIIDIQMKDLIKRMEECGEQGKIAEAQECNSRLELLKTELGRIQAAEEANPLVKQDRRMEVCQVCGSFLLMNDVQKRLEGHFEGKQHAGYQMLWEAYEKLKARYAEAHRRLESGARVSSYGYGYREERANPRDHQSNDSQHRSFPSEGRYSRSFNDRRSEYGSRRSGYNSHRTEYDSRR